MTCREARRHLSPYLDSELDPTTTFEISEHLRVCQACRARFEAERAVDQRLTERLRCGPMPAETWDSIRRAILHPRASWRWKAPVFLLAAAAGVALLIWIPLHVRRTVADQAGTWAVRDFLDETRAGAPFPNDGTQSPQVYGGATLALLPQLAFQLSAETAQKHVVQLVRVTRLPDDRGGETVEVRLNCCGEPVILRFARNDDPGPLADVALALGASDRLSYRQAGLNVAARRVGGFVVLGVSRHPLDHMLAAVSVQ